MMLYDIALTVSWINCPQFVFIVYITFQQFIIHVLLKPEYFQFGDHRVFDYRKSLYITYTILMYISFLIVK